jgi:hypothetical protein
MRIWAALFAIAVTAVGTALVQLAQRQSGGRRHLLVAAAAAWAVIVVVLLHVTRLAESLGAVIFMVVLAFLTAVAVERCWRSYGRR